MSKTVCPACAGDMEFIDTVWKRDALLSEGSFIEEWKCKECGKTEHY